VPVSSKLISISPDGLWMNGFAFLGRENVMGRVAVVYDSLSGNTQKMAELVAEGARRVEGIEVRVVNIAEPDAAEVACRADGIALGSPTNLGVMSWRMKQFWDEKMGPYWMQLDGKIACAFSSAGAWGGGSEITCQALNTVLMNFGFLTFGLTDYVSKTASAHYGAIAVREPREEEVKEACRKLGERLAEWVGAYIDRNPDLHPLVREPGRKRPS
jgi:NAD(P)H dehydrogenase (quinone)